MAVKPGRAVRTGFFKLPYEGLNPNQEEQEDEDSFAVEIRNTGEFGKEDQLQASLITYLFEYGVKNEWGSVIMREALDSEFLDQVESYFSSYEIEAQQVFAGVVGIAAMQSCDEMVFPEEVTSDEDLTDETFRRWMNTYMHVGHLRGWPVVYNPYLILDLAITGPPEMFGHLYRSAGYASALVHNPERCGVYVRVPLDDVSESDEVIREDDELFNEDPGTE